MCLYSCSETEEKVNPAVETGATSTNSIKSGNKNARLSGSNIYYGGSINFNGTTIRTFIEAINDCEPAKIGYEMSASVLNNLPNPNTPEGTEFSLSLPAITNCVNIAPNTTQIYKHVTFLWYPNGTDPQGIFSFPKFDFHFYTITDSERMNIGDANDPGQMSASDPEYIPNNYFGPVGPVPMMGSHWVDLLSPEFNGGAFTKSFIYGSYNGNVVFESISITRAYLLSGNSINDLMPIRQPVAYQIAGYYPTNYRIEKNNGSIRIYLSDFVYRLATSPSPSM
jgi:hypothetical protein